MIGFFKKNLMKLWVPILYFSTLEPNVNITPKKHNDILQEIVLKVFRSRTPSVIQSLVLVYARIINQGVTPGIFVFMKRINLC